MPFVVLTSHRQQPTVVAARGALVAALRNVSLLERPVQAITLTSTIQAAVRARRRQYEVQAHLAEREDAARRLEELVVARTQELGAANAELREQIAERERVEESLRHAQRIEAIGQLTGGVAHDFNNLLMVISGGLDMLGRQKDPARQRRLMDGMRQAAGRGAALTRQLLAFSRRQALRAEPVDLRRQIGSMRELLDRSLSGDVHVALRIRRRPLAGGGGPRRAGAGDPEPGGECAGCDAGWRHHRDPRRQPAGLGRRRAAWRFRPARGDRYRDRDAAGGGRAGLRALLHHQGHRQGIRPRAGAGLWLRPAIGRDGADRYRGRPRHHDRAAAAALGRAAAGGGAAGRPSCAGWGRRGPGAMCCWSRMTTRSPPLVGADAGRSWASR